MIKCNTYSIRHGYDKKKCLVHARCCCAPDFMIATAQYLDVKGSDLFAGILTSVSYDDGKTWTEFSKQDGLAPIKEGDITTVCCDGTPMYHKATGKIIALGHVALYNDDGSSCDKNGRKPWYSVFDNETMQFSKPKFIDMPSGIDDSGNGCGQSFELENGDLLIPVYYLLPNNKHASMVIKCSFDGESIVLLEAGTPLVMDVARGLYEPSVIGHNGVYYMTMRNDECGLVAKSTDGLNYTNLQLWKWDDYSIVQNYNTQQHFMQLGDELYLVYTRRGAKNDHVFRHRAPLFAAKVKNMRLEKASEFVVVPEQGARLGNFGVTPYKENSAIVMAAEWMQPEGCEKYGSDNNIFVAKVSKE